MNTSTISPAMLTGMHSSAERMGQALPLLPFRKSSVRTLIWSFLLGVALLGPALVVISWLPVAPLTAHQVLKIAQQLPLVALASVIVGPFMEEVIFRGVLIQLGRRYFPLAVPVVFSMGLFVLIHWSKGIAVMVVAAPLAGTFSWLALRSCSLWPGFVAHAAFNLTGFICTASFGIYASYIAHAYGDVPVNFFRGAVPGWWLAGSTVLGFAAVVMLRREFARRAAA